MGKFSLIEILQCLMGSGKEEFCHRNLKECPTGCIAGGTIVNHLMYADDIVLLSPSATGLSLLLHVLGGCPFHGRVEQHDIPTRFKST